MYDKGMAEKVSPETYTPEDCYCLLEVDYFSLRLHIFIHTCHTATSVIVINVDRLYAGYVAVTIRSSTQT